ncbi:MAG: phosphoribosylamine--glycine ligase [Candidatus Aenigmarchaeota archaeon]|nr:phosphoribosylamine--glycine ligase [Candidatus Aenigmarchaeota archaeon]
MKVLVVGGGGREDAIARKFREELRGAMDELYVAPGNAGTGIIAQNVPIEADNINALAEFAEEKRIDLTFVGPEKPLVLGIVDEFNRNGLPIVGPTKAAAELEGSKIFSYQFMENYGIPCPESYVADTARQAFELGKRFLKSDDIGVIKLDGLALGKGVAVYHNEKELEQSIDELMVKSPYRGRALMQKFLPGQEASFIIFTDGENTVPTPHTKDYKPVYNNDKGPNTGGMGAYARAPVITPEIEKKVMREIIMPTLNGINREGARYRGILYAGLMIVDGEPYVLEYNCRGGDPETQSSIPLLKSSLLEIGYGITENNLKGVNPVWSPQSAVTVVLASQGYPSDEYRKHLDKEIYGLGRNDVMISHAGTKRLPDGRIVTSGGRVLAVTALGNDTTEARNTGYSAIGQKNNGIYFEGMLYRTDIAAKPLQI